MTIDLETIEKLQKSPIADRIALIELLAASLKNDLPSAAVEKTSFSPHSLKGKVTHYDDPYQPVAAEDWEALA